MAISSKRTLENTSVLRMISAHEIAMTGTVIIGANMKMNRTIAEEMITPSWLDTTNSSTSVFASNDTVQIIVDSIQLLEHAPQLSRASIVKVIVLSVMAIISLFGNIATMWNIYKTRLSSRTTRHSWSAIYSLIFHLSIADVLVTGFCIIGEAIWCYTVQWIASEMACKLMKLFQMFSLYLSTYVLVLIGVDRWIAVKYPMKSLNMAKRCYRLLAGAYVLSFLLSLPQFFIFRVAKGPFIEDFYQCVTHGFYTAEWQEQLYNTITLFFTFIIPLCILFVTYLSTFRTISNSEKMFQGSKVTVYSNKPSVRTNRQRLIHKAKMKSLRISIAIIFAFLICWTPYNVMMIIFTFLNPDKRLGEDLQTGIFFFGMSNSLVNPLIYGAFHLRPIQKRNNTNNAYSLTRGDSQRSPSLITAVTQIDCNGRQTKSFRHTASTVAAVATVTASNYYRTSNGSTKEKVNLLNNDNGIGSATTANTIVSSNIPSPSNQSIINNSHSHVVYGPHFYQNCQQHHLKNHLRNGIPQPQALVLNYNIGNGNCTANTTSTNKIATTSFLESNGGISSV